MPQLNFASPYFSGSAISPFCFFKLSLFLVFEFHILLTVVPSLPSLIIRGSIFCLFDILPSHILLTDVPSLIIRGSITSSSTQVSLVSSLHSTCRVCLQAAISSLLRVERHISHKTRQKSRAEVRRAMRVGSKEEGAGPGAIEAGQSQDGTGGGTGQ